MSDESYSQELLTAINAKIDEILNDSSLSEEKKCEILRMALSAALEGKEV